MWTRIERPLTIPPDVRQVIATLHDAGFDAYLVGGAVRDALRGQSVLDYDVATSARPEQVQPLFPRVFEVGKAFGVLRVISDAERIVEVATFRKDGAYLDGRHPQSVEFSSLAEDCVRRDFSVNAFYYDHKTQQVFDGASGIADLKAKLIRAIGEPEKRFKEDALRLLRAVRFAARFGFKIEPATRAAIQKNAAWIRKVSVERIRDELEKIWMGPQAQWAIQELDELGLLANVLPEVATAKIQNRKSWEQALRSLGLMSQLRLPTKPGTPEVSGVSRCTIAQLWGWVLIPAARVHVGGNTAAEDRDAWVKKVGERLKLSSDVTDQIAYLIRETSKFRNAFSMRQATLLRWMREPHFEELMDFHELDALAYDGNLAGLEFVRSIYPEAKRRFEIKPLIGGDDLVKLGLTPGRQFTEILRAVEDLTLEGQLQTSAQALEYVLTHFVK